jgi:hypothetical protein
LAVEALEARDLPSFLPPVSYAVGPEADAVAVADFNGDGRDDLAVSDRYGVSVFLGNGDGSFQDRRTYPAGLNPLSVAVGDFNGDGFPDLAVTNFSSNNVSVPLNAADGPAPRGARGPRSKGAAVSAGTATRDGGPALAVAAAGGMPRQPALAAPLAGTAPVTADGPRPDAALLDRLLADSAGEEHRFTPCRSKPAAPTAADEGWRDGLRPDGGPVEEAFSALWSGTGGRCSGRAGA